MADSYNYNQVTPSLYQKLIKASTINPLFRLSILNPDETTREDITEYLQLNTGSLSINYQQGQRRSLNFTLDNSDGRFLPNHTNNGIWINTKFKFELGVKMPNGDSIYNSGGIFVVSTPNNIKQKAERTISIQCLDKFALLDGTLGGVLESVYEVPSGSRIRNVIEDILFLDNGNGLPLDLKPLVFDSQYINNTTQYTIRKSANDSLGQIIIELANMLGCDVWYGVDGNLIFRSGIRDISQVSKPTLWQYTDKELEYISGNITYDFPKVKNKVIVRGCNINSQFIYEGISENTNPQSPTRISIIGIKYLPLEDSNIFSNELAQDRADYELNKISILQSTIEIKSTYMIHLDVNNIVTLTDDYYGYFDSRFVMQSINIPISINSQIDITCTNIGTLPFYPM